MVDYCLSRLKGEHAWLQVFWGLYFASVALPLHASNNFLSWITIAGNYTVLHIGLMALALLACVIPYGQSRLTITNALCVTFIVLQVASLFIGGNGLRAALTDFGRYIFAILVLLCVRTKKYGTVDLRFFLYISAIALFVNCCINVLMDVTQWDVWGLVYFNFDQRTGGGYFSLLVFLIPYLLFCLMNGDEEVRPSFFVAFVIVALVGLTYAKNRTTPLLIVFGCATVLVVGLFQPGSKKFAFRLVGGIMIALVGVALISAFLSGGSDLAIHFRNSTVSLTDDSDTLYTRLLTADYYWNRICDEPLGYGLGASMTKLYQANSFAVTTTSNEIDIAPVTFGYHVGMLGLIVYVILLFSPLVYLTRASDISSDRKIVLIVCYLMLLIATGLLTSQVIHNYPVVAFVWGFIGLAMERTPFRGRRASQ